MALLIVIVAFFVALVAAMLHALSAPENSVPLPARGYYRFVELSRAWLGPHPLERVLPLHNRASRRENFVVCFFIYFLVAIAVGVILYGS